MKSSIAGNDRSSAWNMNIKKLRASREVMLGVVCLPQNITDYIHKIHMYVDEYFHIKRVDTDKTENTI